MLLGCIGDDFTGSADLANTLAREGMRTALFSGVPKEDGGDAEAGVIALKTRTCPAERAVRESVAALEWLREQGCRQFLFKYCSTFDSTPEGNIGPVAEALAEALDAKAVVVCPAFPATGRTVYRGHLFVGDRLLSECGMQDHPLTPMTDPDIRRWLGLQCRGAVGRLGLETVAAGAAEIAEALSREAAEGRRFVVVDAVTDEHLRAIGAALAEAKLVTGGSGVALGLPENFRKEGLLAGGGEAWTGGEGPCVILSGSCSTATRAQVERHKRSHPARVISAEEAMGEAVTPEHLAEWAAGHRDELPLIYSSAEPAEVRAAQERFGREAVAEAIEKLFAETARLVVAHGAGRLVTAGGETSGAVVEALHVGRMEIGPEIDPGVPALMAPGAGVALALKSGNFGGEDFFEKAAAVLAG